MAAAHQSSVGGSCLLKQSNLYILISFLKVVHTLAYRRLDFNLYTAFQKAFVLTATLSAQTKCTPVCKWSRSRKLSSMEVLIATTKFFRALLH